jgi:hypothetical protein
MDSFFLSQVAIPIILFTFMWSTAQGRVPVGDVRGLQRASNQRDVDMGWIPAATASLKRLSRLAAVSTRCSNQRRGLELIRFFRPSRTKRGTFSFTAPDGNRRRPSVNVNHLLHFVDTDPLPLFLRINYSIHNTPAYRPANLFSRKRDLAAPITFPLKWVLSGKPRQFSRGHIYHWQ